MNRFIVLAAIIASAFAEAPGGYAGGVSAGRNFASGGSGGSGLNEYVDQALLDRVAAVIESMGDGTAQGQDNEGSQYVDASIFSRVASSLGGSSGGSSRSSGGYGAPAQSGGDAMLGEPEPAQRIAEWDLTEAAPAQSSGGYSQQAPQQSGGYSQGSSSGGYSQQAPSRGSSSGSVSLGQPEPAQRVAEFEATEQQQQRQSSRGNQGGYSN